MSACSNYTDDGEYKRVYTTVPTECFKGYRESVKEIAGPRFAVEDNEDMYQTATTSRMGNTEHSRCDILFFPRRNNEADKEVDITDSEVSLHLWVEYHMSHEGVNAPPDEDASEMLAREVKNVDEYERSVLKVGDEAFSLRGYQPLRGDDRVPLGRAAARLDNMVVAADVTGAFGDPEVVKSYDLGDLEERAVKLLYATVEHLEPA